MLILKYLLSPTHGICQPFENIRLKIVNFRFESHSLCFSSLFRLSCLCLSTIIRCFFQLLGVLDLFVILVDGIILKIYFVKVLCLLKIKQRKLDKNVVISGIIGKRWILRDPQYLFVVVTVIIK